MKNKAPIEKKYLLQILSAFAAIVLWFAITYTDDPSINISINNIQLKTSGEKSLEQNGLIFVNRDNLPGISIEVRGKRSDVQSILNSVSAKVDLSDISEAGEYTRDLSFDVPNPSVMVTKKKSSQITVDIEKSVTKDVPVYIQQTDSDKNKEYLIKSTPAKESISITGTQDDISKIKEALITIDVASMSTDSENDYPISFADSAHSILTPSNRVMTNSKLIKVKNKVYLKKTVEIALDPGLDISGYQVIVKSFSKDKTEIGVERGSYDKINTIYADFTDGITVNSSGKYQMKMKIPDRVYCPSESDELIMTADIEAIEVRDVTFEVIPENAPTGAVVTLNPTTVTVELTGAQSKMQEVKAMVDLSGLSAGTHRVPVVFATENTGVTVKASPEINVTIG